MGVVLKAENVAIRYITGDFKDIGLKEYTVRRLTGNYQVKEFRAVDGVSFELHEGDMLGVIGSNGAGKSTLLKAVAGIMEPTQGKITANGDVAALLELGSGFDGDLTVKENAYLRGAMLGYTKEFMDETYEQIIEFAELKEFENRPFKQLSSGMKSRLAFSIASLVKPDILILDEVLSVGDGAFQEKSAKKMREIISQGATTILVSHSLEQIRELCNKVLWLDHGKQVAFGDSAEICDRYEAFLRGECPAEMPGVEENEKSEAVAVITDDISTNGEPDKKIKLFSGKRVIVSFVLALFCAVLAFNLGELYFTKAQGSQVQISAQAGSGEVTFRGAAVDGIWVSPSDHVIDDGGWYYDDEQVVYTAINGSALVFNLPAGDERTLTFNAGPDCGVALVDIDGEHFEFNLWNENVIELGLPYEVPVVNTQDISRQLLTCVGLIFLLTFITSIFISQGRVNSKKYSYSLGLLRIIACLYVIMIHVSMYYLSTDNIVHKGVLVLESLSRCSVPVFFMLSGFFMFQHRKTIKDIIIYLFKRIILPTTILLLVINFFSGWLYGIPVSVLLNDITTKKILDFMIMLVQWRMPEPNFWLWYITILIQIYFFVPLLQYICVDRTTENAVRRFYIFICFFSYMLIPTLENLFSISLPTIYSPLSFIYLAYVLLGYELFLLFKKNSNFISWKNGFGLYFLGVFLTYVFCNGGNLAKEYNPVFLDYNMINVAIAALGIFIFFLSIDKKMGWNKFVFKDLIVNLSNLTFGVYLIHFLIILKLKNLFVIDSIIMQKGEVAGCVIVVMMVFLFAVFIVSIINYLKSVFINLAK